ncbi:MAG: hypothetical protein WDW19_02340 [Neisseriaceae bacterium]
MSLFDELKDKVSQLSRSLSDTLSSEPKEKLQANFERVKSEFSDLAGHVEKFLGNAEQNMKKEVKHLQQAQPKVTDKAQVTPTAYPSKLYPAGDGIEAVRNILEQLEKDLVCLVATTKEKINQYIERGQAPGRGDWGNELNFAHMQLDEAKISLIETLEKIKNKEACNRISDVLSELATRPGASVSDIKGKIEEIMHSRHS